MLHRRISTGGSASGRSADRLLWLLIPHLLLVVLASLVLIPWVVPLPATGHDLKAHVLWHHAFGDQVWEQGILSPWLGSLDVGLGQPTLLLYPPLTPILSAMAGPAGTPEAWAFRAQVVMQGVWAASLVTAWIWLRGMGARRLVAVVGALLYAVLPYHSFVDVFQRFALAEVAGMALLPLVAHFALRFWALPMQGDPRRRWPMMAGLAASLGLLFMTHLPTSLLTLGALTCLAFARSLQGKARALPAFAVSITAGFALAAVTLLPLAALADSVDLSRGYYERQFWHSPTYYVSTRWDHYLGKGTGSLPISISLWASALPCLVLGVNQVIRWKSTVAGVFWPALGVLALFLALDISMPLWKQLPLLSLVQFPWRFGILLCLAGTACSVILLQPGLVGLQASKRQPLLVLATVVPVAAVSAALLGWIITLQAQRDHAGDPAFMLYWVNQRAGLAEHRPLATHSTLDAPGRSEQPLVQVASGQARIGQAGPARLGLDASVEVTGEEGATLLLWRSAVPGWALSIKGEPTPWTVSDHGLIQVHLPAGDHRLSLRREWLLSQKLGTAISLITLVLLVVAWRAGRTRRSQVGPDSSADNRKDQSEPSTT